MTVGALPDKLCELLKFDKKQPIMVERATFESLESGEWQQNNDFKLFLPRITVPQAVLVAEVMYVLKNEIWRAIFLVFFCILCHTYRLLVVTVYQRH